MHRPFSISAAVAFAAIGAVLCSAPAARANQTFVASDLQGGSNALGSAGATAKLGFTPTSPWYVYGEFSHTAVPEGSRDDATRYMIEGGSEGLHFGFAVRYGAMTSESDPSLLTYNWGGGTLYYRFVPWVTLSREQELFLSREDRKAEVQRMRRDMNEQIPMAPIMGLTLDGYNFATPIGNQGGMPATHVAAWVRWRVKPFWNFIPRAEAWEYASTLDPGYEPGVRSYSSRALRLVRLGPEGPFSGAFGAVKTSVQIYNEFRVVPLLTFAPAITYNQVAAPAGNGVSIWLDFDRYVGDTRNWLVSPSYEHYFFGGSMYSFFMLRVKYEFNAPYIPPSQN